MSDTPTIGHKVEFVLLMIYHYINRILPLRVGLFTGRCLGLLFYYIDIHHRRVTLANLRFAFGDEKTEKELNKIARDTYKNFSMSCHEWIRTIKTDEQGLEKYFKRISIKGEEHLIAARKKSDAVILLSAHFGNWELGHLYYTKKVHKLNFIVRKIDNPLLENIRLRYNSITGVRIMYKENGLKTALKNFKKGEDLVIFADRKANLKEGVVAKLFGEKTATIPLVPSLAKKYKISVVPMFLVRDKNLTTHKLTFYPELELNINGDQSIEEGIQIQNDAIEKAIRDNPDHWMWFHRKWKTCHPELYKFNKSN